MLIKCGSVLNGLLAGVFWEIIKVGKEHYVLKIGENFLSYANNEEQLFAEVEDIEAYVG